MKAAIYARYSSDLQREASIEDQSRNCERACSQYGFQITHRFSDEAMSGAKTNRPGYQALLEAARQREFDIIVVDEVSRLWRDQEEQWRAVKLLEFKGVHILGVSDGVNTASKTMVVKVREEWESFFLPGLAATTYIPENHAELGIFNGISVNYVFLAWVHRNESAVPPTAACTSRSTSSTAPRRTWRT